jgi:hypothetical protein
MNKNNNPLMSVVANNYWTIEQLNAIRETGKYNIFTQKSIDAYRKSVYDELKGKSEILQKGGIEEARKQFQRLRKKTILQGEGKGYVVFISEKTEDELKKGMNGSIDNKDNNQQDQGQQNDNQNNDDKKVSDEAIALLGMIVANFDDNGGQGNGDDSKNDADSLGQNMQPPKTTDEVKALLEELKAAGYIDYSEDNGTCNVTSVSDTAKEFLADNQGGDDNGKGDDDADNNGGASDNDADNQDQGQQGKNDGDGDNANVGDTGASDNDGDSTADNDDDNKAGAGQDDKNTNQDNSQQQDADNQNDSQYSDDELQNHAAQTPTETLQAFLSKDDVDPKHKEIAQAELDKRKQQGGGGNGQQQDGNGKQQDQNQQNADDKGGKDDDANLSDDAKQQQAQDDDNEFKEWLNKHLDDHDIEDLKKYVKKLIYSTPAKLKDLRNHYREDFKKTSGGNSLDKMDDKEFDTWLDTYLGHLPFSDLKDYAAKLVSKSPGAFNDLKKQFGDLKQNNML